MIVAGLGCACLPEFSPFFGPIRTRPLIEPELLRTISFVTVRGRPHTPDVDFFCRLCASIAWT